VTSSISTLGGWPLSEPIPGPPIEPGRRYVKVFRSRSPGIINPVDGRASLVLSKKPGFLQGFDEADRGKGRAEDQRSGKQCTSQCTPRGAGGQGESGDMKGVRFVSQKVPARQQKKHERTPRAMMCNPVHRTLTCLATLMDMAIQRDDEDERQRRIDILAEQFRAAEKRALLKRGIELWTSTELGMMDRAPRPVAKIN